jgi:hypothetical protein
LFVQACTRNASYTAGLPYSDGRSLVEIYASSGTFQ